MRLKKCVAKLDEYYERLGRGKVGKIKPAHVQKTIAKLQKREAMLRDEIHDAQGETQKNRLRDKLDTAKEQIARAEWLLSKINDG